MMGVPLRTDTGTPSMVRLTRSALIPHPCSGSSEEEVARRELPFPPRSSLLATSSHGFQRMRRGPAQTRIELRPELLDPAHDRRGAAVAQHADGLPGHLVGEVEQEIEILGLSLAAEDPLQDPRGPRGALAALGALGAALVGVEFR